MEKNENDDALIDLQKEGQTMEKILLFCYNSVLLYWTGWVAYGLATNLGP